VLDHQCDSFDFGANFLAGYPPVRNSGNRIAGERMFFEVRANCVRDFLVVRLHCVGLRLLRAEYRDSATVVPALPAGDAGVLQEHDLRRVGKSVTDWV
jgi:hypothetical protein